MSAKRSSPLVRAGVDYGPLAVWLAAFLYFRFVARRPEPLIDASWWLIGGAIVALAVGWLVERRLAFIPLIAGGFAIVFGALTLIFQDTLFVKIKPTIFYVFLSALLIIGLITRRLFIKMLVGEQLQMPDNAWRTLTLGYVGFFLFMAMLNIVVWRSFSEATWVVFRLLGPLTLGVLFTAALLPYMLKHGRFGATEPHAPNLPPE